MKKLLFLVIYFFAFGLLSKYVYSEYQEVKFNNTNKGGFEMAIANYKTEIEALAKKFDLPPSYLMSVIMLESSGRKKAPLRFEKKIYNQLLQLKKGKIKKFENLTPKDVKKLSKQELRALASSYGPFQIMGYKSFILNISLDSLKGKKHLFYAVKWINLTYGNLLREGNYKDAFHIHNAGKKFPDDGVSRTYDPDYVKNGLLYEKYFRKVVFKN